MLACGVSLQQCGLPFWLQENNAVPSTDLSHFHWYNSAPSSSNPRVAFLWRLKVNVEFWVSHHSASCLKEEKLKHCGVFTSLRLCSLNFSEFTSLAAWLTLPSTEWLFTSGRLNTVCSYKSWPQTKLQVISPALPPSPILMPRKFKTINIENHKMLWSLCAVSLHAATDIFIYLCTELPRAVRPQLSQVGSIFFVSSYRTTRW